MYIVFPSTLINYLSLGVTIRNVMNILFNSFVEMPVSFPTLEQLSKEMFSEIEPCL